MVVVDDDEREVPFELAVRAPDRLGEISFVMALDQMRHRLGVGLGHERVAFGQQAVAELAVVLDDPVQDDRQLRAVAAGQRVCVRLGDAAVRRPACVPEPVGRGRPVRACGILQVLEVPDGSNVLEPALLTECDAGRVVAAVLETLQALEQKGLAFPRSRRIR